MMNSISEVINKIKQTPTENDAESSLAVFTNIESTW